MSQWSDGQIFTDGIHIHYYRTGGNKPQIVLLHGLLDDGLCWTPVVRVLEQSYDVIMLDARGHGYSDSAQSGFSINQLVADATGVINALALKRPYLLGHSMGAHTAACVARQHPELVRALLLEDPPWLGKILPHSRETDAQMTRIWSKRLLHYKEQNRAELIVTCRAENPGWSNEELELWADSKARFHLSVFNQGFAETLRTWKIIVEDIACPTLLITGDPALGAWVTQDTARQAINTWPAGKTVHIPEAGHCIRRDQYNTFMRTVSSFLTEK